MIHCGIKIAAAFIFGAAAGGSAAFIFAKKKYEKLAQEEIESVKAAYRKPPKAECGVNHTQEIKEVTAEYVKPDLIELASKYRGKTDYTSFSGKKKEVNTYPADKSPFIIPPEEFGEEEYDTVTLTYYSDGVLADESDDEVDIEETVGWDSLRSFGEFEKDSVFVRNPERELDYEVLRVEEDFSDLPKNRFRKPHEVQ